MPESIVMKKMDVITIRVPADLEREWALFLSVLSSAVVPFVASEIFAMIVSAVATVTNDWGSFFRCNVTNVVS